MNIKLTSVYKIAGFLLCIFGLPCVTSADAPSAQPRVAAQPQSAVASKDATFKTVDAASPAVKAALDAKDLKDASADGGRQITFTGTVAKIYSPSNNSIVVLDFDKDYESALTAVVRPDTYSFFPDLNGLNGKTVLVTGFVTMYKGRPQVLLMAPKQVKIITGKS